MRIVIIRDLSNIQTEAFNAVKAGTVLQGNGWSVGPYRTATEGNVGYALFGPAGFEMIRQDVTVPFGLFFHKVGGLLGLADACERAGVI